MIIDSINILKIEKCKFAYIGSDKFAYVYDQINILKLKKKIENLHFFYK